MNPFPAPAPEKQALPRRGLSPLALVGFALGVLSVGLLLNIITGVPAIVVGILAIRRINRAAVPPRGLRLALAGVLLGAAGCLLAVVGVVAMLVGNALAESQRAECSNNLRLIGQATAEYHAANHNTWPPGSYYADGRFQPFPPEQRMSWLVTLLPYLELPERRPGDEEGPLPTSRPRRRHLGTSDLHDRFHFNHPWDADVNQDPVNTSVRLYLCPSFAKEAERRPAWTHYVGSAGLGADAATLPLSSPDAGFFGYDRVFVKEPGQLARGQSNTLLCGESTRDNGPWAACGSSTVRGLDANDLPLIGKGRAYGGAHRGGANLLMVDGHVTFFNDRGSPEVIKSMVPLQESLP